jgi:hypothetical protein
MPGEAAAQQLSPEEQARLTADQANEQGGAGAGAGTQQGERQLTPIEETAMKIGWNPDYEGENKVDAETYILRSRQIQDDLAGAVKSLRQENRQINQGMQAVRAHFERVHTIEKAQLESRIQTLTAERDQAIEDADKVKVHALDKQIREAEALHATPLEVPKTSDNPEFEEWNQENTWYGTDREMTTYADALANDPRYGNLPPGRLYKTVEKIVKEMFPDKFPKKGAKANGSEDASGAEIQGNGAVRPRGGPGPEGVRMRTASGHIGINDLTDAERENMAFFIGRGIMKQEDYLKDIEKMRKEGL